MIIHIVADTETKRSAILALLGKECRSTSELLERARGPGSDVDGVVVAVDLSKTDQIATLRRMTRRLTVYSRRIFLVEQRSRLVLAQALALGATSVLPMPVSADTLKAVLRGPRDDTSSGVTDVTSPSTAGANCLSAMFSAVMSGSPIDIAGAKRAGGVITEHIAERGLSEWLETVRRHHEGTFQHCLLVTGVAIDFGLSLGLAHADIERLYMAAMLHDIGKASIPRAVLDKPGRLDDTERALIETHPAAGYDALKANRHVSAEVLDAVRHHHEYLDGSGYPDGLCGENIQDVVRVLTISDIFAALIEQRPYRLPLPRNRAYEILHGMNGKLEEALVRAFRPVALLR